MYPGVMKAMKLRFYQCCLLALAASALPVQAQKKASLVWAGPVKVYRVTKPYTKPARPLPRDERVPLLTLQWHLLARGNGNVRQPVNSNLVFETGDQLKLNITTNQDGYLYVINQTAGRPGAVIFPDPRINDGRNDVKKNQGYTLPSYCPDLPDPGDCWWTMAPPAGAEELIVIFSRDKITTLPSQIAKAGETVDEKIINDLKARSRQNVKQATGSLQIPGRAAVKYATRVQNTNHRDNEELITTIRLKHGE
jgi:hypothetical protein